MTISTRFRTIYNPSTQRSDDADIRFVIAMLLLVTIFVMTFTPLIGFIISLPVSLPFLACFMSIISLMFGFFITPFTIQSAINARRNSKPLWPFVLESIGETLFFGSGMTVFVMALFLGLNSMPLMPLFISFAAATMGMILYTGVYVFEAITAGEAIIQDAKLQREPFSWGSFLKEMTPKLLVGISYVSLVLAMGTISVVGLVTGTTPLWLMMGLIISALATAILKGIDERIRIVSFEKAVAEKDKLSGLSGTNPKPVIHEIKTTSPSHLRSDSASHRISSRGSNQPIENDLDGQPYSNLHL